MRRRTKFGERSCSKVVYYSYAAVLGTSWTALPLDVKREILCYLPLLALQILLRTNEDANLVRPEVKRRVFTVLKAFRLPPQGTLQLLHDAGGLLAGSAALEVVLPGTCVPGNLDFVCPRVAGPTCLSTFVDKFGFVASTPTNSDPITVRGACDIHTLHHPDDDTRQIRLVVSHTGSALMPILFSHVTIIMNFVSSSGVGTLYPAMTTQRKGSSSHQLVHRAFLHYV